MATVKLLFAKPPVATPGPVRLVFGDDGGTPAIPNATLHGGGRITGLRLRIGLRVGVRLSGGGRITGLRLQVGAQYRIDVARPTVGHALAPWAPSSPLQTGTQDNTQDTQAQPAGAAPRWQHAAPAAAHAADPITNALRTPVATHAAFAQGAALATHAVALHQDAVRSVRNLLHAAFANAARAQTQPLTQHHQDGLRDRRAWRNTHWQVAQPTPPKSYTSRQGRAQWLNKGFGADHQNAMRPPPGIYVPPPPIPVADPCYLPTLPAHLVFDELWTGGTHLVFVCERHDPGPEPKGVVVVPVRKVYVTVNSITLRRVAGNVPLQAESFSMSIDVDSWTWNWSASLPASARQYLVPVDGLPVVVEATVNGVPYRLCAESMARSRTHGSARINVQGRGLGAVLDAPYSPALNFGNATTKTAQQLAADALTLNGVGIGWDVAWGLTDWQVPAGLWTHQGSYISAVNAIATAAGGYVQPHATAQTLRILPRYPAMPWAWGALTPDYELPADVVEVEGVEWVSKPAYNWVHVAGVAGGVQVEAKRAGTAGDVDAPGITDPLITHVDAARQRAAAVLADTGPQATVSLRLPVLATTGLIQPGKFVRYLDGAVTRVGIVRGTALDWQRPTLRQTLTVETHGTD